MDNTPPIQNTPNPYESTNTDSFADAYPINISENTSVLPNNNASDDKKKRKILLFGLLLVLIIAGAVAFFIFSRPPETTDGTSESSSTSNSDTGQKPQTPANPTSNDNGSDDSDDSDEQVVPESSKPKYDSEKNESGERELFGSDGNKNNSGEAFVEYQAEIINDTQATNEETFDAKILTAVYYIAVEQYTDARETLNSIDQSTLSADQLARYNQVFSNLQKAENGEAV